MLCNWSEAARYSKLLKDNCKWSSAVSLFWVEFVFFYLKSKFSTIFIPNTLSIHTQLFHYLYAIMLQQQMDLEGKKELEQTIEEGLA